MFDPLISEWFTTRFGHPTEPQLRGWPEVAAGRDVLISAPTGSGKTLAAFLVSIDTLVRRARAGSLTAETHTVYVSPLKALTNDVHKNLEVPLAEIQALAAARGLGLSPIRTATRTGDTASNDRQRMAKNPPHILVTTPESLFILLTAERSREMLKSVRCVIVDEIHAIAGDKRGSHLALSLARLEALTGKLQRIGLSATVRPIESVARFLSPTAQAIDIGHRRDMDLAVEVPRDELGPITSNEMWAETYARISELIQAHRTTLVFVNTRRLSERVAHSLAEILGADAVLPHHGSLSRELRLDAEEKLKQGKLRAVVATASLELGIDIGTVDLVCQIGSPRSLAVALQRIGRSGHWVGAQPKARLFPLTRDELIEAAGLIRGIRRGALESIEIPPNALDILAQQVVAECASRPWREDDLFEMVRSAHPYRNLPKDSFTQVVAMLSDGIATLRGRSGAHLHRDQVNGILKGRRGARIAAITSGGAIPDTAQYRVVAEPDGRNVGTLDEDFAIESMAGDIFLLGTHSWQIKRVEPGRVRVVDAGGAPPTIPFWLGEGPGRSAELSAETAAVRDRLLDDGAADFLIRECGLDEAGARQAVEYVRAGTAALGALPSAATVVAERFFDEAGGQQLVIHAPFGARITKAWGLALRKRFCRTFNFELQAAAIDNGLVISLGEQHSFPLDLVFELLRAAAAKDVLEQALLAAPLFGARWRWNATRALAVLRFNGGRKVPAPILRMRCDDLLAAVFPDQVACAENLTGPPRIPDHPLVNETLANCLYEGLDLNGLVRVIEGIESGAIRTVAVDTSEASPFSHEILNANPYAFLDDAPLEERRARAVNLRRTLRTDVDGSAVLDAETIAQIATEVWPEVRDADEFHDALLTLVLLPPRTGWEHWYAELARSGRAHLVNGRWCATERLGVARDPAAVVRGWMDCSGPVTAAELERATGFPLAEVAIALAQLEGEGQILQGKYRPGAVDTEWCHRRILARIHRATLGKLRREIEPVSAIEMHRFLCRWQHVAPGGQLHGPGGLLQVIRQLQGYEIPAAAWESQILPARVARYEPALLDELCLSGEVMWARLQPPDGRARASRIAPVSLLLREDAAWLMDPQPAAPQALSHPANDIYEELRQHGAAFFQDLVRGTRRLPSEVEDGLWELVASGLVTADGFENLRSLVDPKRRRGEGKARTARPRHAAGRWALVRYRGEPPAPATRIESFARQLLIRWGVVFRDLLARETLAPPWRDLLPALRKLEAQGEIRGGRFVMGFGGEQFARPEAVDLLRSTRRAGEELDLRIPNADPLNLTGILLPGARVSVLTAGSQRFGSE
ncbi:MAG: DEAD/DEAH box helicase [Acidobacteria bacterium]|nr:DEAD/DEAH box helicase [Acidobacteriota bacterium]